MRELAKWAKRIASELDGIVKLTEVTDSLSPTSACDAAAAEWLREDQERIILAAARALRAGIGQGGGQPLPNPTKNSKKGRSNRR
jgi:hypothetical protein